MKTLLCVVFLPVAVVTGLCVDPVVKFDDIPNFTTVPAGYHLLNWTGFQTVIGAFSPPNGYQAALQSGSNVIYSLNSTTASISGGMFDFLSVYATAAYDDNLNLEAKGFIKGTLVYDQINTLSATAATLIQYNYYGVDEVDFISSGGTAHVGYAGGAGRYFAMDNMTVTTYLPYIAPYLTNGGFEASDFSAWTRSGNSANNLIASADTNYIYEGSYGAKLGPTGTPGYMGQTISPVDIGQSYTVSFWLKNGLAGVNNFGVFWNGTTVLALTNLPAFGYTNFQFDVVAWRPSEFLQFQFQNDPSYFGLDDVIVTPKELVNNGGFESGNFSGWMQGGETNHDHVMGSPYSYVGLFGGQFGAVGATSTLSQSITTQPGQPYLISAWYRNGSGSSTAEFHALWGGQPLLEFTDGPSTGWTNYHWTAVNGNSQNTLQFGFRNDLSYSFFDEASVHSVPLLKNGGFELGDFTGWTRSGNPASTAVSTNKLYASSGYYGAQFGPTGLPGFISQNLATIPGQTYLIGFMLSSKYPLTNSEFSVSWNGVTLMDTTNLFLTGQVPYQFTVTAPGTNTTLQFGFRNDPDYFGFDDAFVSPIPAPELQSIAKDASNLVNLSWSTLPGYVYAMEYTTNLSQPKWTNLNGFKFPLGFEMQGTDTNPPDRQRFYRIEMFPPPLVF
jgi:hypothetical protein